MSLTYPVAQNSSFDVGVHLSSLCSGSSCHLTTDGCDGVDDDGGAYGGVDVGAVKTVNQTRVSSRNLSLINRKFD